MGKRNNLSTSTYRSAVSLTPEATARYARNARNAMYENVPCITLSYPPFFCFCKELGKRKK